MTALIRSLPKEHAAGARAGARRGRRGGGAAAAAPRAAASTRSRASSRRCAACACRRDAFDRSRGCRRTCACASGSRTRPAGPSPRATTSRRCRAQAQPRLRSALGEATAGLERRGLRAWTLGELPRSVALAGTGDAVRAYPALVDEGDSVAVRTLDTPEAQAAAMWAGTRRLLLLGIAVARAPRAGGAGAGRPARARGGAARERRGRARGRDRRGGRRADRRGGRAGVGRGRFRAPARPRRGGARGAHDRGGARRRAGAACGARGAAARSSG